MTFKKGYGKCNLHKAVEFNSDRSSVRFERSSTLDFRTQAYVDVLTEASVTSYNNNARVFSLQR